MKINENPLLCTMTYAEGAYVDLHAYHYGNGRIAIQAFDVADGEPMFTATVNMVDALCKPDEAHIKDWSENEGCVTFLLANGIIEGEPTGKAHNGYIVAPCYKLAAHVIAAAARKEQWEVQHYTLADGFINTSTDDDGKPITFDTEAEAIADMKSQLQDIRDAVKAGDMVAEYDPSEFRVAKVGGE